MKSEKTIWKEFLFPEIFKMENGFYNKKPISNGKGTIPFLGATQYNNGITEFYSIEELEKTSKMGHGINHSIEKKIFKGNCIAVTNNGSVGYAYYQVSDFSCSHDINPLYLKNHTLTESIAIFLIAAIEKQKVCFEYARKWRPMRMKKSKLLLPVNSNGNPDFEYMESCIQKIKRRKAKEYSNFISKRIDELSKIMRPVSTEIKEWKEIFIEDVLEIKSGKRLVKSEMFEGNIPFIGATDSNNGITEFISNINSSLDRNVLGVNYNGSVVENFYHPYEAIFSDDVKRLSFKEIEGNKYQFLFIKTLILKQKSKYEYGYKFNGERMKRQKIMLPVDKKGKPDYQYMEDYMKYLEHQKLKEYLEFKK